MQARCLLAACLLLGFPRSLPVEAQQNELSVRAAYIYNLTKYVSWPHLGDEIVIGVAGNDDMGQVLKKTVDGKMIEGKKIRVLLHPSEAELQHCNILYVPSTISGQSHMALERIAKGAVLTVGENDRFVHDGGMVGLVRTGDQIQLEINLDAARGAGLQISSRLLKLAVIVHTDGKRG
jgi:hypothetical protein